VGGTQPQWLEPGCENHRSPLALVRSVWSGRQSATNLSSPPFGIRSPRYTSIADASKWGSLDAILQNTDDHCFNEQDRTRFILSDVKLFCLSVSGSLVHHHTSYFMISSRHILRNISQSGVEETRQRVCTGMNV